MTYLFISHDLALVDYFCQRIMVMYLGQIVEITQADLSRQQPAHPYTKFSWTVYLWRIPVQKKLSLPLKVRYPVPLIFLRDALLRTGANMPALCAKSKPRNFMKSIRENLWPAIFL